MAGPRRPLERQQSCILVHGLLMTGLEMALLRRRIGRCGFRTFQFHYPTLRRDLAANAALLARFADRTPGEEVHFVGHSYGGLVIRRMLADFPQPRLGRVVTLGTPHQGSRVACALAGSFWGRCLLGRSRLALMSPPDLPAPNFPLGVVAGTIPVGAGRLFTSLPAQHDGTVALDEAVVEGAADELMAPVSHTSMLFSAALADQICCFLREGHFKPVES